VSVQWTGLEEFRAALRNLPDELTADAAAIVTSHAQEAERLTVAAYPVGPTGNLQRGVRTTVNSSDRGGASATVRSGAKHAHLFEKGTGLRRTNDGANRGRMPAAPSSQQMIPIVIRVRRRMVVALVNLVQKAGLVVTK
jgi:hypothetical protein